MHNLRALRSNRTKLSNQVRRQIEWMLTSPASSTLPNGLPRWWLFWSDVLYEDVRKLVRLARELRVVELSETWRSRRGERRLEVSSLLLRNLSNDLITRIRRYARRRELDVTPAAVELIEMGLTADAMRRAGAQATNARRSPEERSEAARRAVQARWARVRAKEGLK